MKIQVLYVLTGRPRGLAPPAARAALLRAGWQRLHPGRPFPAANVCTTAQGRPHLPGEDFSFSLSHAHGLSVLACAPHGRLGIDVAHARDAALVAQVDAAFFSAAEQRVLAQQRFTPLQLWARKEAVLKADGRGLLLDPAQADVSGPSSRVLGQKYRLYSTRFLDEYELALATPWADELGEGIAFTEVC